MSKVSKGDNLTRRGRLHRTRDELDVQHDELEVGVGVQEPKERVKLEWDGVSGKFQFHKEFDGEQCEIEGCLSQRKRPEL